MVSQCVPFLERIKVHCIEHWHGMKATESFGARVDGVEGKLNTVSNDVDGQTER